MIETSILIVNWNGENNIEECLISISKQNYKNFEVIVIDNASTDNSLLIIERKFGFVKLIKNQTNIGFAKANNIGLEYSKGKYIVTLNNDLIIDELWLEKMVGCLNKYPEIGLCACKMKSYYRRDIIDRAGDYYTIAGTGVMYGNNEKDGKKFDEKKYIFGACAGAAIYRKSMLKEIGFFDEDFFLLYEDIDLSFRAQLHGYKCLYIPDAIAYHKCGDSIKKVNKKAMYFGYRNIEYAYIKNFPTKLIFFYLIFHLIYDILSFIYSFLTFSPHIFIKAKFDVLLNKDSLINKRKKIQKSKEVTDDYINSILLKDFLTPIFKRRIYSLLGK